MLIDKLEIDVEDEEEITYWLEDECIHISKTPFFYVVCDGQKYIEKVDNALISCGILWNNGKFDFNKIKNLPEHFSLMLDSGGFQLLSKFNEYPFTCEQYYEFVNRVNPNYFVSMDYPCGDDKNVKEKIEKTISNLIKLKEFGDERLIPVLQGYKLDDYLYCLDRFKEQGLISDYMGIGSLVPKEIEEAKEIILNLTKELKGIKIHIFGMKLKLLENPEIFRSIYSFDTMNYLFNIFVGRVLVFSGDRLVELQSNRKLKREEIIRINLKSYLEYHNYLWKKFVLQSTLISKSFTHLLNKNKKVICL
jgi:hypothetical protein